MQAATSITNAIRLGAFETVPDRPFTDPKHNAEDIAILDRMRARLRHTLSQSHITPEDPVNREVYVQYVQEEDGRLHRMVILDRITLQTDAELTIVGFFGQKRGEASPALLQDVDTELIQEFLNHRYVLSYSSLELADGNWANMVLLLYAEGILHWRASQKHAYAARELAPLYYTGIRLHNGILPGGIASPRLVLQSTKYYDFNSGGLWQAVREERIDA